MIQQVINMNCKICGKPKAEIHCKKCGLPMHWKCCESSKLTPMCPQCEEKYGRYSKCDICKRITNTITTCSSCHTNVCENCFDMSMNGFPICPHCGLII